jgi:hypothetical protein
MLEIGQDLPLDSKTAEHFVGICASLEYFDRYALLELSVGALGKVNGSHATTSEFSDDRIRTDAFADAIAFIVPEAPACEFREFFENTGIVGEQPFSLKKECCVMGARLSEHCRPPFD